MKIRYIWPPCIGATPGPDKSPKGTKPGALGERLDCCLLLLAAIVQSCWGWELVRWIDGLLGERRSCCWPMIAPRRRPSYSLVWGTPHDHQTQSHWSVILSISLAVPCRTIMSTIHLGTRSIWLRRISFYTCVTKIGLIVPDDLIKGLASRNTQGTTSIKFTPKWESFPFAAFAPGVILRMLWWKHRILVKWCSP